MRGLGRGMGIPFDEVMGLEEMGGIGIFIFGFGGWDTVALFL